jgi:hypothetical protein
MSMTGDERARVVSYLRETKALVMGDTAALTPEQWRFKPTPASWSAAQCIEHITIIEAGLLETVQAMAAAPEAPADQLALAAGRDELLIRMIRSRKHKVIAPESVQPASDPADPAEVLARFERTRDRTIAYLETTSDPIRTRVHPHYILGPFDGYQWMLFCCSHAERHLRQIREAKEHPDFPK